MKKRDYPCLLLSILINLAFLFALSYKPSIKTDSIVKIGLVSVEKNQVTKVKNEKNSDSNQKKIEDINKSEIKKETSKVEKTPTVENSKKEIVKEEEKKPSLADLKKAISSSKPKIDTSINESNIIQDDNEDETDRILGSIENEDGLISGNKLGTLEGKVIVKWNSQNRKPVFPEKAELSGKNGKVVILLKVDKLGTITYYRIEQGSGVPEIDAAIEKVIGSWRINLLKNDRPTSGTFYINYNFNLK